MTQSGKFGNFPTHKYTRLALPMICIPILFFILHMLPEGTNSAPLATLSLSSTADGLTYQVTPTVDAPTAHVTATAVLTTTPTPMGITPSPSITTTSAPTLTPTLSIITPTITPVPTLLSDQTSSAISPNIYLPMIIRPQNPVPPEKALFCPSIINPIAIPDNDPAGINNSIVISDNRIITDLDVALDVNHTWIGDLRIELTHAESSKNVKLIVRPGVPETTLGCGNDNIRTILDEEISSPAENKCASSPAAISGIYQPQGSLSQFDGISVAGTWNLNVSDVYPNDTGSLGDWCLVASISEVPPPPTPEPPAPSLPSQAVINGVTGKAQALPLDCESRSAVDWSKYFGYTIGELTFFNKLPTSDNPDKGFVGDVNGTWGQIPPRPYGVHAEPVAALLRTYGVPAYAHRPLKWELLKAEIAAGNPVIVWIIGSVDNGIPVYYTPSDGLHTIVARYEHTVIVTGYTSNYVYYLNGATIYSKTINQFLDSWSALGNMAITTHP